MDVVNSKYQLAMTVLTPLSIGSGAEKDLVDGADFVKEGNKAYVLDLKKVLESGIDINDFSELLKERQSIKIIKLLRLNLEKVSSRTLDVSNLSTSNGIKSFIRNELVNKPIVPGSSIKGSIRSILFKHLKNGADKESLVFGSSKDGDELMRFFKFADVEFSETKLANTKIFNLYKDGSTWKGGWKHGTKETAYQFKSEGFNSLYEILAPDSTGICTLMISNINLFDKAQLPTSKSQNLKKQLFQQDVLFKVINDHTKEYLRKEIAFFEKFPGDRTKEIIQSLKNINGIIPQDNSRCIFKMSAGSGFHSITGDWQYDDYSSTGLSLAGKKKYKSRKVAEFGGKLTLMGFVELCPVEIKEEERRQLQFEEYKKLISDANILIESGSMSDVERKIVQAKRLYPDGKLHIAIEKQLKEYYESQKSESDRLATMSPDEREKEKYLASGDFSGELVNASISNPDLTKEFYRWLKSELLACKRWSLEDTKKDKWGKRCIQIEEKLKE